MNLKQLDKKITNPRTQNIVNSDEQIIKPTIHNRKIAPESIIGSFMMGSEKNSLKLTRIPKWVSIEPASS